MIQTKEQVGIVLLAACAFLTYAGLSVFTKEASFCSFLSWKYLLWVSGELFSMFIYALLWQKLLAQVALNRAFLYKSSTILIVFAIMHMFYGETITMQKLVGFVLIMSGLFVLSTEKS